MQICIIKKQKLNKTCRKNMQNVHAAQAIPRTPSQSVNRKMLSDIEDVDQPWKFNIDRKIITCVELKHFQNKRGSQMFSMFNAIRECFAPYIYIYVCVSIYIYIYIYIYI